MVNAAIYIQPTYNVKRDKAVYFIRDDAARYLRASDSYGPNSRTNDVALITVARRTSLAANQRSPSVCPRTDTKGLLTPAALRRVALCCSAARNRACFALSCVL